MERVRHEVRSKVPGLETFTPARLDDLPFLDACILETLRLKPVAPMLPVMAVRDAVIGGLSIPKGTVVVSMTRPNAVSAPSVADPRSFRPERWLPSAGRAVPAKASIPFGSGPRLCPGRYLATLEMKMAAAMLLGRFSVDRIEAVGGGAPREVMAFAMGPSPLRMALSADGGRA